VSEAVATLGTVLRRNGTAIAQVQDIEGLDLTTDTDEITNHDSPGGVEEFIPTIKRTGEVTFPLVFIFSEPTHDHTTGLLKAWEDRSLDDYEMEYPDGSGWMFAAYVTGFKTGAPVDGHLSADVTLRVSGAPTPQHSFAS
jgi:Lambda phage tail tube protein, TTP